MLLMSLRMVRQCVASSSSLMDISVPVESSSFWWVGHEVGQFKIPVRLGEESSTKVSTDHGQELGPVRLDSIPVEGNHLVDDEGVHEQWVLGQGLEAVDGLGDAFAEFGREVDAKIRRRVLVRHRLCRRASVPQLPRPIFQDPAIIVFCARACFVLVNLLVDQVQGVRLPCMCPFSRRTNALPLPSSSSSCTVSRLDSLFLAVTDCDRRGKLFLDGDAGSSTSSSRSSWVRPRPVLSYMSLVSSSGTKVLEKGEWWSWLSLSRRGKKLAGGLLISFCMDSMTSGARELTHRSFMDRGRQIAGSSKKGSTSSYWAWFCASR